ncbi:MAG: DUF423 domain-containing protein [Pseudomonadota bacterium]|nr:DUF423 domain-containing protein [Pseudomonadota bacterium]MEC7493090.1 DUF423 domain-containing protein [Pseudomonadota bacterium]MEC7568972.1 DUF423 domain-containing protein [Pseudomonadota bacterium]MEC7992394.1 DUF423 domain-containing protein [Pseudomonadota bacterium]MEC8001798.1 DUF423 domain-containing protein [Pseudomonadota bacterium]|tara:strand:+ start:295 stop:681 length:387 start_codon:yes stop_codon:yes gene_type:complete
MRSSFIVIACLLGLMAVALGAFGAHALSSSIPESRQATWATAVDYHMFHVLGMLALAAVFRGAQSPWVVRAQTSFVMGIVLFSGSLYALVLLDIPALGAVTPFGGLCFMLGWLCAGVAAFTSDDPGHD